jgi:predicted phage terminase large subunit-like protein
MSRKVYAPASKPQEMFLTTPDWVDICFYGGQAGGGKALLHGEKVLTPRGFVNIESCEIGQEIVAPDNSVQYITGVFPQGEVDIYEVIFQDGRKVKCCGQHLWKFHKAGQDGKKLVQTTIEIKEYIDRQNLKSGRKYLPIVQLSEPLEFGEKVALKIKPYTMGLLLGDGCFRGDCISLTTTDQEIIQSVNDDGYATVVWESSGGISYRVDGVKDSVIGYDLYMKKSHDKFIPQDYFTASIEDRFSLIQGLMDSDGYVSKDGKTYFCTVSNSLASDVTEILRSLGFTVTTTFKKTFYNKDGEKVVCKDAYVLYIRGKNQTELFRLPRKKSRTVKKDVGNRIESIECAGKGEATCISVTGDRLFVTTDFVVTHNTFAGLMHHLKYTHDPLYRGLTLRRTTPMLLKSGAVWDESKTIYTDIDPGGRIKIKDLKYQFSSGAEVAFSHFERVEDTRNFQGAQISSCVMEELCQFEESQFNYILSRLRTKANMKPNMRATMNPDPDSWVRQYVDWYLFPEGHENHGRPDPSKQGVIRWFIRTSDGLIWADTKEELEEKYPNDIPLSFRFISASVYDNPYIQPSYIAFLNGLPRVEREILLFGNWEARPESSSFFQRSWCEELSSYDESQIVKIVRAYDFAGTLKSDSNPSPDYTATVKMAKMRNGDYLILDAKRTRIRFGEWQKFIIDNAMEDKELHRNVDILIPSDPNPAAAAACTLLIRDLAESGLYAQKMRASTSKLDRFRPASSMAQNGGIKFLKNCAHDLDNNIRGDNNFFYRELEAFDGQRRRGETGHDDLVDCVSDCFAYLASKQILPNFLGSIQNFQQAIGEPKVVSL